MAVLTLTDLEVNYLTAAYGALTIEALRKCLCDETLLAWLAKSVEEFEQRAKIIAYLTFHINDNQTTN